MSFPSPTLRMGSCRRHSNPHCDISSLGSGGKIKVEAFPSTREGEKKQENSLRTKKKANKKGQHNSSKGLVNKYRRVKKIILSLLSDCRHKSSAASSSSSVGCRAAVVGDILFSFLRIYPSDSPPKALTHRVFLSSPSTYHIINDVHEHFLCLSCNQNENQFSAVCCDCDDITEAQ